MRFVSIHSNHAVLGIQLYVPKEGGGFPFTQEIFNPEKGARDLIESIEEECCIVFLEALIVQAKKAINRHAQWCEDNGGWETPPEWAVKYQDAGI